MKGKKKADQTSGESEKSASCETNIPEESKIKLETKKIDDSLYPAFFEKLLDKENVRPYLARFLFALSVEGNTEKMEKQRCNHIANLMGVIRDIAVSEFRNFCEDVLDIDPDAMSIHNSLGEGIL